eukprot:m.52377 g.52377  ORF g.52377 m.52377 type:complete len:618 (+) comp10788_c0_seq1:364-2217(+)
MLRLVQLFIVGSFLHTFVSAHPVPPKVDEKKIAICVASGKRQRYLSHFLSEAKKTINERTDVHVYVSAYHGDNVEGFTDVGTTFPLPGSFSKTTALNYCINNTKSDYIAIMDVDTPLTPEYLKAFDVYTQQPSPIYAMYTIVFYRDYGIWALGDPGKFIIRRANLYPESGPILFDESLTHYEGCEDMQYADKLLKQSLACCRLIPDAQHIPHSRNAEASEWYKDGEKRDDFVALCEKQKAAWFTACTASNQIWPQVCDTHKDDPRKDTIAKPPPVEIPDNNPNPNPVPNLIPIANPDPKPQPVVEQRIELPDTGRVAVIHAAPDSSRGCEGTHREPSIVYHCSKTTTCGGLGDQIAGMAAAYHAAKLTNRKFFIVSDSAKFLKPASVPWNNIPPCHCVEMGLIDNFQEGFDKLVQHAKGEVRCLQVHINQHYASGTVHRELLKELFQPPDYNLPGLVRPYAAVHVRTGSHGDFKNKNDDPPRYEIKDLDKFLAPIFKKGWAHNVFLATDSEEVKHEAKKRIPDIRTFDGEAKHLDKEPTIDDTGIEKIWNEFFTLVNSDFLVFGRSGYGEQAWFFPSQSNNRGFVQIAPFHDDNTPLWAIPKYLEGEGPYRTIANAE